MNKIIDTECVVRSIVKLSADLDALASRLATIEAMFTPTLGDIPEKRNLDPTPPAPLKMDSAPSVTAEAPPAPDEEIVLVHLLRRALDSLEYVATINPTFHGYAVRFDLIRDIKLALDRAHPAKEIVK